MTKPKLHELSKEEYKKLKGSGMFWELYPEATGNYQVDSGESPMSKPTLTAIIGIPASGKTTWAKKFQTNHGGVIVERDELRKKRYENGEEWSKELEKQVTDEQSRMIADALIANHNVIVSDTNINPKARERLMSIANECGARYEQTVLWCNLDIAMERNKNREGWKVVPDNVMRDMYVRFVEQFPIQYKPDISKDAAYCFDLDGTLAEMKDRSPYDWSRVIEDVPNYEILAILDALWRDQYKIIIMSGRDSVCRPETEDWLSIHDINYDKLVMRPEGNNIRDNICKHDLFHKHIAPNYNVMGCFDDRKQVTTMLRKMGLRVFQVSEGDF